MSTFASANRWTVENGMTLLASPRSRWRPSTEKDVVLLGYYPPPLGGESVHVSDLAQRLRAEGWRVRVINAKRGAPPSRDYHRVSGRLGFMRVLLETLGADRLLHVHTNGHHGTSWRMIAAAAAVRRLRPGP